MAEIVAVVGLVVGAVGAERSRKAQSKVRKSQERAQKAQGNIADLENARSRRQQLVQARRQRAAAIAQGENQGIGGGSQVAGVVSSVATQAATNVSFLNQLQGFDQARFANLEQANKQLGRAATFQAIGQAGQAAAGASQNIANLFGSSNPKGS